jgi:hypothetical protein
MWEIGSIVRVECGDQKRRGMIACVNISDEDPLVTFDIIFGNNSEENHIPASRLTSLLSIENSSCDSDPQLAKLCGNYLFELKDYEAAYEYYLKAHHQMQVQESTIGKRILVRLLTGNGTYEVGMISDLQRSDGNTTPATVDVIYDRLVDGSDEEEGVCWKRIVNLFELKEDLELGFELQRSVFLNLSKCATKRKLKGWAVHWALLASGLIRGTYLLILSLIHTLSLCPFLSQRRALSFPGRETREISVRLFVCSFQSIPHLFSSSPCQECQHLSSFLSSPGLHSSGCSRAPIC